jgi:hypothetical protein
LKNYQHKLKSDEDSKINNVIDQVRLENRLQLDKYDQIFKKRDDNIRKALDLLTTLGSQLSVLSRTRNPTALKFSVHKTILQQKQCVEILTSLINGESNRRKF